jgi:hypothetical protein
MKVPFDPCEPLSFGLSEILLAPFENQMRNERGKDLNKEAVITNRMENVRYVEDGIDCRYSAHNEGLWAMRNHNNCPNPLELKIKQH